MIRSIEKKAKTSSEAILLALDELGICMEDAEIQIINEGSKPVLGFIGGKEAKVVVTEKITDAKTVRKFLNRIFIKMKIEPTIAITENESSLEVNIEGQNVGGLIGRHGETLAAIQYLINLIVNKGRAEYKRVIIDVENYRKRREETLIELSQRLAERVLRYKKPVTLEPMSAYERRIIHSSLQDHKNVETVSQGEEPNRRIVIRLK